MQRRRVLQHLAALGGLALFGQPLLAQEGKGAPFTTLANPQPTEIKGKLEVIEFFHYGCPHCRAFDPLLTQWLKTAPADVAFRRVPAIWANPKLLGLARFFYTAEATGDLPKLHSQVFDAVQDEKLPLETEAGAVDWVKGKGVDAKRFAETYKSFGVQSRLQRADQLGRAYQIQGVPTLAIDGKYLTSAALAGSHEAALKMADELIVRARKEQGRG